MVWVRRFDEETRTVGDDWVEDDYAVAECGKCGEMTPVCCETGEGPYCAVCCPRSHKPVGAEYQRSDCGWDE